MKWLQNYKQHFMTTVLAYAYVGLLAVIALNTSFLNPVSKAMGDFSFMDIYYQIQLESGDEEQNDEITIVDMSALFSRRELANALRAIQEEHPKYTGVDMVFEGLREDSVGDEMIWDVAAEYDKICWSHRLLDYENDSIGYTTDIRSFFAEPLEVTEGFTNMQRDLYGSMKRMVTLGRNNNGKLCYSFIAQVVNGAEGKDFIPLEDKDLQINFTPTHFNVVMPDSIHEYADLIKDHIVLFGTMTDENDMHYTPLGKMAGVELLAYAGQTLMYRTDIIELPGWLMVILSFLIVMVSEAGLFSYAEFAKARKNRWARFVMSSTLTVTYLTLFWMIFLVWVSYIMFYEFNLNLNLGWALSAMAFRVLARNFYKECVAFINEKKKSDES